jgi:hypothetical protein
MGMDVKLRVVLISAVKDQFHAPASLTPGERRVSASRWIGDWTGPSTAMIVVANREISAYVDDDSDKGSDRETIGL